MSNAWTGRKQRSIINFLVNCPTGTMFYKSIDASNFVKTGEKIFELLDSIVEEIEEEKVVQVITDNESNYVLVARCIDLMLEDIGKLPLIKKAIQRAISLVGFIYSHSSTLSLLRFFTNKRELVRHAITRIATSFLTLERLHKEKGNLRKMFASYDWTNNKLSKEAKGKEATKIVLVPTFWNNVLYILKVLRLVDNEKKPTMAYIYEAMEKDKEAIMKSFEYNESKYKQVFEIIGSRWTCQLHCPLHAAGHFLNPDLFFNNPSMEFDFEVVNGLYVCIEKLVPDQKVRQKILIELPIYKMGGGMFGAKFSIQQKIIVSAVRRDVNTIGVSLSKNRLEHKRLHNLVYIKYNALVKRYNYRDEIDPISLNDIDECNEWLVGQMYGDDGLPWDVIFEASGIGQPMTYTRQRTKKRKEPLVLKMLHLRQKEVK
ncbi:hypothetical protein GmHk_12G034999 [Glycine max]|nr:hypothetical protein GmHk_12G034999 [Glycine max]